MARDKDILNGSMTFGGPDSLQNRYEYNADGTVLYAGYAPRGTTVSQDRWTINMFTYVSQQVTLKQTAFDSWDNRSTAEYL